MAHGFDFKLWVDAEVALDLDLEAERDFAEVDFERWRVHVPIELLRGQVADVRLHADCELVCVEPGAHRVELRYCFGFSFELALVALYEELAVDVFRLFTILALLLLLVHLAHTLVELLLNDNFLHQDELAPAVARSHEYAERVVPVRTLARVDLFLVLHEAFLLLAEEALYAIQLLLGLRDLLLHERDLLLPISEIALLQTVPLFLLLVPELHLAALVAEPNSVDVLDKVIAKAAGMHA